jgi:flagellar hook-associated protein 2
VNSIVTQLVALEKAPLKILQTKATLAQSQISSFGQVQSQFSALADVASRISNPTVWAGRIATSSVPAAANVTADGTAQVGAISLDVTALAQKQSLSSGAFAKGLAVGAGSMTLRLGTWNGTGAASTFAPATGTVDVPIVDVLITISATDTVADIAKTINATAGAGVVATVFSDGTNDRLLLSSKTTGAASGFRIQSTEARLEFDPQTNAGVGMSGGGTVTNAQDAQASINGWPVTSTTNTLSGNVTGISIDLLATTTTPLTLTVADDATVAQKNVGDFVTAYNNLNQTLSNLTKYDSVTKQGAIFQGDSSVGGLRNSLRSMLTSLGQGPTYTHLSDVGLQLQVDGSIKVDDAKLKTAVSNGTALQDVFASGYTAAKSSFTDNEIKPDDGFAVKFWKISRGALASGGAVDNKAAALQKVLDANGVAQDKITSYAVTYEANLRKRYSALDAQMASLNALSSYVNQQVASWNKSTG